MVVTVVVVVVDAVVAIIPASPIVVMYVMRRERVHSVAVIVASVVEEPSRASVVDWRAVSRGNSVVTVLIAVLSNRTAGSTVL